MEMYTREHLIMKPKFLFESIKKDFGQEYITKALNASQKHVNYYSTLGKGNLSGLQRIINEMKS